MYNEIYHLVREKIMNKSNKSDTADENINHDINELDLGIETLGEVE